MYFSNTVKHRVIKQQKKFGILSKFSAFCQYGQPIYLCLIHHPTSNMNKAKLRFISQFSLKHWFLTRYWCGHLIWGFLKKQINKHIQILMPGWCNLSNMRRVQAAECCRISMTTRQPNQFWSPKARTIGMGEKPLTTIRVFSVFSINSYELV